MHSHDGSGVRRRFGMGAALAGMLLGVTVAAAPPAAAFLSLSVAPSVPDAVVGQTVPAALGLSNNSTPPESINPLNVSNIDLYPACSVDNIDCSGGTAETGVYSLSATGSGFGPASCTGTWTLAEASPGRWRFSPPASLQLAAGESCMVNFTMQVLRMPTFDASAAVPGVQTNSLGAATAGPGARFGSSDQNTISTGLTSLSTVASQSGPRVPGTTTDTATLSAALPSGAGGAAPTGSITFRLWSTAGCDGNALVDTVAVNGFGTYTTSAPAQVNVPGTFRWTASYSGDANYTIVETACNDPAETVTFAPAQPVITLVATPQAAVGQPITSSATLTGGFNPTGTVTFTLFGPNNAGCAQPAVFTSTGPVNGSGMATSAPFSPSAPGVYRWVASYSGDAANLPTATSCGDPAGTTVVSNPVPRVAADFDGDGKSDVTVFRPGNGAWFVSQSGGGTTGVVWGAAGDYPVAGDYDGDGKADLAVFRASSAAWFIQRSSGGAIAPVWGASDDIPVPADYDGDGKTDLAVFRPSNGVWYVNRSSGGSTAATWGTSTDLPLAADFDGDGKADLAVFRASSGTWFISRSSGGAMSAGWGMSGDVPIAGDFDGDGKADLAVWRPSSGTWFLNNSGGGSVAVNWGVNGDRPVAGDYDGDGKTDLTVFRHGAGTWFRMLTGGGSNAVGWGTTGDITVPTPVG